MRSPEDILADIGMQEVPLPPEVPSRGNKASARNRLTEFTAAALEKMSFPPINWIVPGYIVEGCTLLAGAPKLGKSWLALDIAVAVARGGMCMGAIECERGDVLYLALEDNPRRLQSRMRKLTMSEFSWPEGLAFATESPRSDDGGLDKIRAWARACKWPRLVIVDVLAMFKATRTGQEGLYDLDYRSVKALQELASELGIAVVVVHHTRKSQDQVDPFEKVSGTLGLSGAADSTLVLSRDSDGVTLYGRGRDIPEIETAVRFDRETCKWAALGEASEVHRTDQRKDILAVLERFPEPMSPKEIMLNIEGSSRNAIDIMLFKMASAGEIERISRGKYALPGRPLGGGKIGKVERSEDDDE